MPLTLIRREGEDERFEKFQVASFSCFPEYLSDFGIKFGWVMCMFSYKGAFCISILFLMCSWFVCVCSAVDKFDADEALANAESNLAFAYGSVAEAESAGADVSELIAKLKIAGSLLAEAYNFYRVGNYDEAYSYATNCSERVGEIVSEASTLKLESEDAYREGLLTTAGVSSAVLSVLFILSLFVWRFLKNKYFERVLGMKPEVREG